MTIKVTGGTGYIGNHVVKYLDALNYKVDVISKVDFGRKELGLFPDVIVHCAWPREKDLDSDVHLQFASESADFFRYCAENGVRVINIGSSSEYGVKDEPMREDMICEPITAYGIAKLSVTLTAKRLGFNTLRLFTVYGEGGSSFFDVKDKAKLWGSPTDMRDRVPIEIVCKAVERVIHAKHLYGEIINVGGEPTRYQDVGTYKDRFKWLKYPQRQYEPRRWEADKTKMRELLNL